MHGWDVPSPSIMAGSEDPATLPEEVRNLSERALAKIVKIMTLSCHHLEDRGRFLNCTCIALTVELIAECQLFKN